ncbi:MAG TPA: PilZ domain-containing protein, partial [Polyangiaceae bacterium LLY-WYZ-15_(1-7)]|nr:PilZ domain-containing protein [Polyangiaceae bacterium LLY-WYZ-15_(1-7)]
MLEPIDVVIERRQSPRRAGEFDCLVIADAWDQPVPHVVRDLSEEGLFLRTELLLEAGEELVIELALPSCPEPFYLFGEVRHAVLRRREGERHRTGFGVELVDTAEEVREALRLFLGDLPPALPGGKAPVRREHVWVDALLTWEEDLGDRVNTFEVSEALLLEDAELEAA